MALVSSPDGTRRYRDPVPPLPVSFRLDTQPWVALSRETVGLLRVNLTNHETRGDCKDDGVPAGSQFKRLIDEANEGEVSTLDWHTVIAWPEGSRFPGPIAWCLLRPVRCYLPTLRIGTYTSPRWRRRNIGRVLINEAVRLAHQLGIQRVVASPWNDTSLGFFTSVGFEVLCRHGGGMSGLAELDVPATRPNRLPWRCRAPERSDAR
jgi:GNAT superfamily N-acetyltransferase